MFINGVGAGGERINVAGDFSIYVPYGWCYDVDDFATDGKPILTIGHPTFTPTDYDEGFFDLDDDTSFEVFMKFQEMPELTEDATAMDLEIDYFLKKQSEEATNITMSAALNFMLNGSTYDDEDDDDCFNRMYRVVKRDPFLKAGYFTNGLLGKTVYNVYVFTNSHIYCALQIRFSEDDDYENQETLDRILATLKPLNVKKYEEPEKSEEPKEPEESEEPEGQLEFKQPEYSSNNKAMIGPLSVVLPDDFDYVTDGHIPANDNKAVNLLDNYVMVAAPADCEGGLSNFKDASLGINISKPQETGLDENKWKDISAIKKNIISSNPGRNMKIAKEGTNSLLAYGRGNECGNPAEPYWVSYYVMILCGSLHYSANLYFNSKKTNESEYTKAVENFCSHITVNTYDLGGAESDLLRDELGDMIAENGRMDGILASQLYSKDVIFNNDDEVTYDGTHTIVTSCQFNSLVMDKYPNLVKHVKTLVHEMTRVIAFVDQNEDLMIPKSKFHPNILNATRNNPITGATFFELCAWHMLLITESEKNKYNVAIDSNLINGIPHAFSFVAEFIKTLRAYNEIYDNFEVTYVSTLNVDGPCGKIVTPVRGAVTGSTKTIKVKGGKQGESDSNAEKTKEIDSVSAEDHAKSKIERLESKVDIAVKAGLKADAKEAKALFTKISTAIKAKDFNGLDDIEAVIEKVNEAVDESIDILAFNLAYMYRPFVNSYEMAYFAQNVISNADFGGRIQMVITENTFNPNAFPKSLCGQLDSLTEEDIYAQLLESAEGKISEGHEIISESQGTQYEGRIEQIEDAKTHDAKPGDTAFDMYNWTFTKGNRKSGKGWSVAIPDGFVVIDSKENRVFEAVPQGMEESDPKSIPIRILPGVEQQITVDGDDMWMYHPYAREGVAAFLAVSHLGNNALRELKGSPQEIIGVGFDDLCAYAVICDTSDSSYSYQCQVLTDGKMQALRVQTGSISDDQKKTLTKSILTWIKSFKFDKPNAAMPKEPQLESSKVLSDLKNGKTTSFDAAVERAQKEYMYAVDGKMRVIQYLVQSDMISVDEIGEDNAIDIIREILIHGMDVKEFYYQKADELIEKLKSFQVNASTMKKVYKKLEDLEPTKTHMIGFNGEDITVDLPVKVKEIQKKWKIENGDPDFDKSTYSESLDVEARMRAIEKRKKAREARRKADEKADKLAGRIVERSLDLQWKYESNVREHKRMIEGHAFDGPLDPKISDYISNFDDDIDGLGNAIEELLSEAFDGFNAINDKASPGALLSVIKAMEEAIDYVGNACIVNYDLDLEIDYDWNMDIQSLQRELERNRSRLKKEQNKNEAEERKQEEEDRRFEEAQKYGVDENDLDSHKNYLAAKKIFDEAKTSKDFEDAAQKFKNIKNYLDSDQLLAKCEEKIKTLKPIEEAVKEKKRLNDDLKNAEKALANSKSKRSALDSKEVQLKQDIVSAENTISDLEEKLPASKARIESELDTKIREVQLRIDRLREEKTTAEKSIEFMQARIAGLSIFDHKLKKELTQKVEETRASLPKYTEDIRRLEADCDDLKKKSSRDISSLQQQIEDEKGTLAGKKAELEKVYDEKKALDSNIVNGEKKVGDLKVMLQR